MLGAWQERWRRGSWSIITRNSGLIFTANVVAKLLSLVTIALILRRLGAVQFGWYSFVLAYMGFAAVLPELGLESILTRDISTRPEVASTRMGAAVTLRLVGVVAVVLGSVIVFSVLPYPAFVLPAMLVGSLVVFAGSFSSLSEGYFRARLSMVTPATLKVSAKAVALLLVVAVLPQIEVSWQLHAALWCVIAPDLIAAALLLWKVHSAAGLQFSWGRSAWVPLLEESWSMGLSGIAVIILTRSDVLILSVLSSAESMGYYAAAYNLVEVWGGLAVALGVSLLPILSKMSVPADADSYWPTYRRSVAGLTYLLVPVSVLTGWYSSDIVRIVYGADSSKTAGALGWLIWGQVFAAASVVYISGLVAHGRQHLVLIATGTAAVVNVGMNLLLIPRWDIEGASISTLVGYVAITLTLLAFREARAYAVPFLQSFPVPIGASAVFLTVLIAWRPSLWWGGVVSAVIYIVTTASAYALRRRFGRLA